MRALLTQLATALAALLVCQAAQALNPAIRLEDLNHTRWSEKDGAPSGVRHMAQTRDGWLWLATFDGLYRFDGISFERYPLKYSQVQALRALDNGDLVVGFAPEGLLVVHANGKVSELPPVPALMGSVKSMDMDRDGALWAATVAGVFRYAAGRWHAMFTGAEWADRTQSLLIDQYDRIWVANRKHLYRYDAQAGQMVRVDGAGMQGDLLQSADGRLWISGNDDVLRPVPAPQLSQPLPRAPDFNQAESRPAGQFDRDGNLWAILCPRGICRINRAGMLPGQPLDPRRDASERLDQTWHLADLAATTVLEDREGNIWIASRSGLDRFRENKLVPTRLDAPSGELSVASDADGTLWLAEWMSRGIWTIGADGPPVRDPRRSGTSLATDRDGALLIAGSRDIERIHHGRSTRIPLPTVNGKPTDLTVVGLLDDGKVLWMVSLQTSLMGWVDGKWLPRDAFPMPQRIYMSALGGGPGQLWLSNNDGSLIFYDNGNKTRYDIALVGQESGIFPGPQMVVSGERGLAVMRNGKFELLAPRQSEALRNISGLAVTPDGDRWLNGPKGLVHVRRADWEAALRQPAMPLAYELIDALEGYPGRAVLSNRQPSIYNVGNGVLWLRASGGMVRLDTKARQTNPVKPVVQLLRVTTDKQVYAANAPLLLPPDSRNFNIQYTAPGLRKPESMRFQYMLEGVDARWQDAGSRRAAYYTNIGPGEYVFQVRAVNEDGVASETVATLPLQIAPTMVQTWWFQLLCIAAGALLLYGIYQYRLKQATTVIARQLQVRMDERERIARTLHDTFLQSVQALVLRVYAVLTRMPEGSEPRARLEAILDDADRAMNEGRDQMQQLRSGQDIEQQLNQAGAALAAQQPQTAFRLDVEGVGRPLSPPVQEELCAIALEALRNAFQHARAANVGVRIEYHDDGLLLMVADDGRGLDQQEVRKRMQERHFGMLGMRERARFVGAAIDISSAPGQGTVITLKVPARLCYAAAA
ncbi:signal transduction histidine kinase/ligand-binding sensor domain-containing protein [Duganella sp. 1224]|uniref:sensor histidine kinase n=1 Tax=Duganella sp. 1224 TaxID=2587052 RepID=UPI0015C97429|nr:sensor histidine kinase [Duganella sp. 1224]NYE63167.1 signal transduction histidine kinase/ligand-binding sensor domain-containing protein [Duganella sp. 1224]